MKAIVMLPTYNERENLKPMLHALLGYPEVSVVIVDDQSPDGTGEIADQLTREFPGRIHVIHRQERGRGTAGITGFRYCFEQNADCIIEMDADFSHNPKDIPRMLEKILGYDVVIGSRAVAGGKDEDRGFLRKLITGVASLYTQIVLGVTVKDWSGGFKCYRKEVLAQLPWDQFYSRGYSIGAETLYRLIQSGATICEIPIHFENRRAGTSKFNIKQILEYLLTTLRLRLHKTAFTKQPTVC